jgi:hypothetical protein
MGSGSASSTAPTDSGETQAQLAKHKADLRHNQEVFQASLTAAEKFAAAPELQQIQQDLKTGTPTSLKQGFKASMQVLAILNSEAKPDQAAMAAVQEGGSVSQLVAGLKKVLPSAFPEQTYTIGSGDNLWDVATKSLQEAADAKGLKVDFSKMPRRVQAYVQTLIRRNSLPPSGDLAAGQTLKLPWPLAETLGDVFGNQVQLPGDLLNKPL